MAHDNLAHNVRLDKKNVDGAEKKYRRMIRRTYIHRSRSRNGITSWHHLHPYFHASRVGRACYGPWRNWGSYPSITVPQVPFGYTFCSGGQRPFRSPQYVASIAMEIVPTSSWLNLLARNRSVRCVGERRTTVVSSVQWGGF